MEGEELEGKKGPVANMLSAGALFSSRGKPISGRALVVCLGVNILIP